MNIGSVIILCFIFLLIGFSLGQWKEGKAVTEMANDLTAYYNKEIQFLVDKIIKLKKTRKEVSDLPNLVDKVVAAEIISEKRGISLGDLVDVFADIPSVDIEERAAARWVLNSENGMTRTRGMIYVCSTCGERSLKHGTEKYCSECGARMNGGKLNK